MQRNHVHQCFHAVGHGTFITGVVIRNRKRAFNWIYDCGSKSANAMNAALARTAAWPVWADPINMLVLSHFDDDHVNGLEALLTQRHVNCLVLPFSEWQQRVRDVVIGGLKGVSASTAQLQLSPLAWLQAKGLEARVGTLLLVRGGARGQQDGVDPVSLPGSPAPDESSNERQDREGPEQWEWQHQESPEQRDLRLMSMAQGGASGAAPGVQLINHGMPVCANGVPMEFMFYNAELSGSDLGIIKTSKTGALISRKSKLPLQDARDAIEAAISTLGLNKPLTAWPVGWRAHLKGCYESHFGSSSAAKNNISLCMYVGPAPNVSGLSPCGIFNEYEASPPLVDVDAGLSFNSGRPAMLCTGDLRLDPCVISAMQSHFGPKRWGRIGITQVPHHGSQHSWVAGNAMSLTPSAFVQCAPGKGAHPHANVVADLTGQTVFTADYQSSVSLKYHF